MKKLLLFKKIIIVILLAGPSLAGWAQAPFTKGNIAVLRVGDGVAALASSSTAAFIDEYTTSGVLVQSIAIPTTGINKLTNAGSSGTEGLISLSPDGQYLTLAGYDVAPGTASIAGTTSAVVPRKILRVDNSVSLVPILSTSAFSTANIRSAVTTGNDYWASGSKEGVNYFGTGTPALISNTILNLRSINIFNGQLYFCTGSGNCGIYAVGTGLPTTSSQTSTMLFQTGVSSPTATSSPNAFALNSSTDICYVADDRSSTSGGGVQKWTKSGTVWSLSYTLSVGTSVGARGLIVDWSGVNPVIYASNTATLSKLVKITDIGAGSTYTDLATSSANTAFRGIAFTPFPAAIIPTLTITSPVTGDKWVQGSTQTITWTATGTNANLMIEYTGNASATNPTWYTINPSIAASLGTYTSTLPADLPVGDDYKIRISDIPQTVQALTGILSITAAPAPVATFNPANAATGIAKTSDITITFDVPVRNLDNSDITDANVASLLTLTTTDALGTAVPFTATIDALKKVITINPSADLAYEQVYYVAIAAVEGVSNNATAAQHITFTSAASLAPEISSVTVAGTAPYYAGDLVTINWVSKNVTNVQIEAWIPSESKWDILVASTPSDGTETFTIPIDAQYSTDYKIRVSEVANATVNAESSIFTIMSALTAVTITEVAPYYAGDLVTVNWVSKNITNVLIEAWIPGESKWEILSASTPSDGSEAFTIPASAQYSTAYKIRVTDVANATVTTESSAFTVIAVVNKLLLLRTQPANAIVKYTGIATVTYTQSYRNQKFIQDATAAVVIDDPTTAPGFISGTYLIGGGITNIVGKIVIYNGLIELTPTATTGEPATGTVIVPEVRTLASLTSADQCKLVKIENFAFKNPAEHDATGKFIKGKFYEIDGIAKTSMAYNTAFYDADYCANSGLVPVGPISSICIVGQKNAQMLITARSWSDMTIPTVADFEATPTFVVEGETVQFKDLSTNNPTSWEWTFEGGTPATSTDRNPLVTYSTRGTFNVTLKATNLSGGNNTITKTGYINVGVVGISTLHSDIAVYPNPTNGRLFITNPSKDAQEIVVFNAVGKKIMSSVSTKDVSTMNIASQSKGMFLVRITNTVTKSVQFKKVVLY